MEDVAIDDNGRYGFYTGTLRLGNAPSLLSKVYGFYITLRPVEYTNKTILRSLFTLITTLAVTLVAADLYLLPLLQDDATLFLSHPTLLFPDHYRR